MKTQSGFFQTIADMLFPARCFFCGKLVGSEGELCVSCTASCRGGRLCRVLPASRETFAFAPYEYGGLVKDAILAFKFNNEPERASFFAKKMAESLPDHLLRNGCFDTITVVPMSAAGQKKRGYNQAELLGKGLAKYTDVPFEALLEKQKENKIQHDLPRDERKENVKDVYACMQCRTIQGKRILLADDILTTGATLCECVRVLYDAGAEYIVCVTAAQVK